MYINKKNFFITLGIIVGVFLIVFVVLYVKSLNYPNPPEELVECIANNSILYIQKGCHYCEIQEQKFGKDKDLLNIVDCFYEENKCLNITATPTWIINGKMYEGVFSIEELKDMTGCS